MTAIGELLRAVLEAGTWTAAHKPDIIYVVDESQHKSGSWTNNAKLFIYPMIEPWGEGVQESVLGRVKATKKVHFFLQRNDGDDDKAATQLSDMISILTLAQCTGHDDNYIDRWSEIHTRTQAGTKNVAIKGEIVVEDWVV